MKLSGSTTCVLMRKGKAILELVGASDHNCTYLLRPDFYNLLRVFKHTPWQNYLSRFTRVGICLLALHYSSEALFHAARLMYFLDKAENGSKAGYLEANAVFVLVRLGSIILSVLTFWYGLSLSDHQGLDVERGNFNTPIIRIAALAAVCLLQAWLMWNFITFHLKRRREQAPVQPVARKLKQDKKSSSKKKKEEHKRNVEDDELPEVDQNTKKSLRSRVAAGKSK